MFEIDDEVEIVNAEWPEHNGMVGVIIGIAGRDQYQFQPYEPNADSFLVPGYGMRKVS